jgi:hypothetical protein
MKIDLSTITEAATTLEHWLTEQGYRDCVSLYDREDLVVKIVPHLARAFREALLSDDTIKCVAQECRDKENKFAGLMEDVGLALTPIDERPCPTASEKYHNAFVLTAACDHVFGPAEQEKSDESQA